MKARVNSPLPKVAAGVNIGKEKAAIVAEAMAEVGGEFRAAESDCGADIIGYICGHKGYSRSEQRLEIEEELLIFSGLEGKELNAVVSRLRELRCSIPLKATVTEHNIDWTVAALAKELVSEHEFMQNRGKRDGNG